MTWVVTGSRAKVALACVLGACLGASCGGDSNDVEGGAGESGVETGAGGDGGQNGESGGTAGGGAAVPCPADSAPIEPASLIDDFEDGDHFLAQSSARNGSWWVAGDATPGAQMTPAPGAATTPPERILGGRCGSSFAMRVTGQGYDDWGAVLGLAFRYDANGIIPDDLSAYRGVTFWAKVGEVHTAAVRVDFGDTFSDPGGGVCDDGGGAMGCHDPFGTALVPLSTEWRQYVIYFDTLAQRGFGLPREALATDELRTLAFALSPGSVFDLSIDDVWLVR